MKYARPLAIAAAAFLVLITLPFYATISGLSFMAFDSPTPSLFPWIVVGIVVGVSILVPVASLIGSILLLRRYRYLPGMVVSLLPAVVLGMFWVWLTMQSFS
jgi:hypothetical protein